MSTDPKLIEAVARAYAKIADGAVYDAMPPASREMYAKRVMPIITAYEAGRGDGVLAEVERLRPHYLSGTTTDIARRQMLDHFAKRFARNDPAKG